MANDSPKRRGALFPLIIALVVVGAIVGAPFYLPAIRSDQDKLDTELRPSIERAASKLSNINANLTSLTDLRKQLDAADVKLSADAAASAADKAGAAVGELEKQLADTAKLLASVQRRYPNIGEGQPPSEKLGGTSGLKSVARTSFSQFQKLLADNEAALQAVKREIDAIKSQTVGEARAANSFAVTQLAAIAGYQQGTVAANRADLLRRMAQSDRAAAADLLQIAADAKRTAASVAAQIPTALAEQLEKEHGQAEAIADKLRSVITRLDAEIKSRTAEMNRLRASAAEARARMRELEAGRRDLSAAQGEYAQLAKAAREAERKADSIERGTLAGAQVELPSDGDLLEAKYLGGSAQPGLVTLIARRDGLKKDLAAETELLGTLQKQIEQTSATREELEKRRDEIGQLVSSSQASAEKLMERAAARSKSAREDEQKAIAALEAAGRSAADAARNAQQRARDARDLAAKASPDKPNERLKDIADDKDTEAAARFLGGQIAAATSEEYLARVRDMESAGGKDAAAIADARKKGLAAAEKAISEYSAADKLIGGGNYSYSLGGTRVQGSFYRWQFQAAEAGAHLLASQFAESSKMRDEQREKANQLLTEAVKQREGSPLLSSAVDTIIYLQKTAAEPGTTE